MTDEKSVQERKSKSKDIGAIFIGRDLHIRYGLYGIEEGDRLVFSNGQITLVYKMEDKCLQTIERAPIGNGVIFRTWQAYRTRFEEENSPLFYNSCAQEYHPDKDGIVLYGDRLKEAGL
jgi:hypothetical protein